MKTHSFSGFHKTPIWDVLVFVWYEIQRDDLFMRAQAISFSFFMSLFPAIIALFTMIPLLSSFYPELEGSLKVILANEIQALMPGEAGNTLYEFIENILTQPRLALRSFGFLLAIYFSSSGMVTLMKSFEKTYEAIFRQRSYLEKQMIAIGLVFILFLLLVVSVVFIVVGNFILNWLIARFNLSTQAYAGLVLIRWAAIVFIFYTGIAFIFRYGSFTYRPFSFSSPGTTVATIFSILVSVGFSFYVDNFGAYNVFYGSLGTLIVLMIWIQFNVLALLIGFELNVSIAIHRDLKKPILNKKQPIEEKDETALITQEEETPI